MSRPTQYEPKLHAAVESSLPCAKVAESDLLVDRGRLNYLKALVVLDDDPTGTQTVHGISVLTTHSESILRTQLRKRERGFFVLTNTRALHHDQAKDLLRVILTNLRAAASKEGVEIEVVTRSDSCLRGHFPLEPDLVNRMIDTVDGCILAPAFFEGGRITIDDVHYVREGPMLVPVAGTPFAKDKAFGFQSSNLREWVVEKYNKEGKHAPDVTSISIEELRHPDAVSRVASKLEHLSNSAPSTAVGLPLIIILNAVNYNDMATFIAARARTDARFVYRSGASLVSAYLGIGKSPPLSPKRLFEASSTRGRGGLIIVGSYVPRTTAQLEHLLHKNVETLKHIELDVSQILAASSDERTDIVRNCSHLVNDAIAAGVDVVVSTSRILLSSDEPSESLSMGNTISEALCDITRFLETKPRYVIAKGGITSSDIATKALGIKKATVLGQVAPGIPVWEPSEDCCPKWPGLPYVVFPGNTGEDVTLGDLVWAFRHEYN
ncbi:hypothetical protein TGAM01_v203611 [Trichoderma gamsii]|uniref:Uncharacterized protein n=1 Tax=Trichoderma gamsii TaxID=398673 RepID=A0A2P4ZU80_9HYPO|nr:hypothetical protein TGAM01_v203611 [Trichoderma gamsii]PON27844.1 hypothetical protein TGAM01_v203611 [Trichoderma gamsii]